jgi:hypothetical protein
MTSLHILQPLDSPIAVSSIPPSVAGTHFFQVTLRWIPIEPGVEEKLVVRYADLPTRRVFSLSALFRCHGGERGPALLNVLAAAGFRYVSRFAGGLRVYLL